MDSPNYLINIKSSNRKQYKIFQVLFSIFFSLSIILLSVKFTLAFKPLYYFDINHLKIEELSNLSEDEIKKNYDYVIDYLLSPKNQEFKLPSIPYSEYGQIHFKDVKKIFTSIDILLLASAIISIIGLSINIKRKKLDFLKQTSLMLLLIPLILFIIFAINFDTAFIIFHKIFFKNDYWQFNPEYDPIINILPQGFFYHSALLILTLILSSSIILWFTYKKKH